MKIAAAVLREAGRPLEVEELELEEPRRDEVLVRLQASGICRSDLSLLDGKWPAPLPMVLGHEGAGTVAAPSSSRGIRSAVSGVSRKAHTGSSSWQTSDSSSGTRRRLSRTAAAAPSAWLMFAM